MVGTLKKQTKINKIEEIKWVRLKIITKNN